MADACDSELDPSELGTQSFWKSTYVKEIGNFDEHGDPGEVWFGEDSAFRVTDWICKSGIQKDTPVIDLEIYMTARVNKDYGVEYITLIEGAYGHPLLCPSSFNDDRYLELMIQCSKDVPDIYSLEIEYDENTNCWVFKRQKNEEYLKQFMEYIFEGCGNGYTLCEMAREGFTNLLGVDYCEEAITLARKVAGKEFPEIQLKVFNITSDIVADLGTKFGLVHDKGTYDAISLNPDNPKEQRLKYIRQVYDMLQDKGLFVITSCNWTEDEIKDHFKDKLVFKAVIPSPQFKFGGKTGSVVSSVVFIKDSLI